MNTTIDERVRNKIVRILQQRGIKQKELASMIGVMPQNLNAYMTGKRGFGKKNICRIAKALDIPEEDFYSDSNVSRTKIKKAKRVPLISWVKAGLWHEAVDIFQPGYADQWLAYDTKDEYSFCLTVEGNSMEPEFKAGDIVVVSPSLAAVSGNYVVAKFGDDVTLKKLKILEDSVLLKPLNPDYDDIVISGRDRKNLRIVGKVIAKYVEYY
ncbi:MAG: helix-turn-helix domain-containing protein [Nitrospirae bacterium]|nr:helix-turn-helix domain-containing protein [Nitrospirota bacterium]